MSEPTRARPLRRLSHLAGAFALFLLASSAARASDGRVEISQTKALAGGVTPGDAPGFPVDLFTPGSYVLTSDLLPGIGSSALVIRNNPVTIDLNGFAIRGPGPIGQGSASGIVSNLQFAIDSTIRNGVVARFQGLGIDLATVPRVHLDGLLVTGNQQGGAALGDRGHVTQSRFLDNAGFGLSMGQDGGYSSCVLAGNLGGPSVTGAGVSLGQNLCDDGRCDDPPPRLRRYYVTRTSHAATGAPTACAPGFHFASLFEIRDTSNLRYDTSLGQVFADSGEGPPQGQGGSGNSFGWMRTGWFAGGSSAGTTGSGFANCQAWTTNAASTRGTAATPVSGPWNANDTASPTDQTLVEPWEAFSVECNTSRPVWCVEDYR